MQPIQRVILGLIETYLEQALLQVDELGSLVPFQPVELPFETSRISMVVRIARAGGETPVIAGKIPATPPHTPTNTTAAKIRAAHRRVLDKIPVGRENRVKAATVLRQLFPDLNSYNRALVTQLLHAHLIKRDDEDGKVYRPA